MRRLETDRTRSSTDNVFVVEDAPSGSRWQESIPEHVPDETTSVQGLHVMPEGLFGVACEPLKVDMAQRGITEIIFVDDPLLVQKIKEKDAIIQELISELKEARVFESDGFDLPDDYFEDD